MATGGEVGGHISDCSLTEDLSELKCQPCHEDGKNRDSVGMCLDCQDYLCQVCFDGHTLPKPCRNHKLLDKQQLLQNQVKIERKDECRRKCSSHDDVIKFYCIQHGHLGCGVCLFSDHRNCKSIQHIPDAAKDLDKNLEFNEMENRLDNLMAQCKVVTDIEQSNIDAIEKNCSEVLENIENHRSKINEALDEMQAEIVQQAQTMKTRCMEKISKVSGKFQEAHGKILHAHALTKELKKRNQNCSLYTEMMALKDNLDAFDLEIKDAERKGLDMQVEQLRFTPGKELLELLDNSHVFGSMTDEKYDSFKHINDIDVTTSFPQISGSVFLSSDKLILTDCKHRNVIGVDINKKLAKQTFDCSSRPWDICKIKEDRVAVSLPDETRIVFIKVGCDDMTIIKELKVNGACCGLDYKDDKLAVSFECTGKVQILSLRGKLLYDISADYLSGSPYYLAFDKDGKSLYVSDYESNKIVCMELDGTLLSSYTSSELQRPMGIAFDSGGNVYLCGEQSNNIHRLSSDLSNHQIIVDKDDMLQLPWAISCTDKEKSVFMFIGFCDQNNIKVFRTVSQHKMNSLDAN